ncbi:MAG TPA: tRNA threonylcarbamoyladenosine dehydratase [Haloplasmataceae bacterium]
MNQFSRNVLTFGREGQARLHQSSVMVVGLGGVGSYAVEALVRSGIGRLILVDKDRIDITNMNRQLHATLDTVGKYKCDVMKERILSIYPECQVITYPNFLNEETLPAILAEPVDFIIDAIDTVSCKFLLIKECLMRQIPFISVMGAANKLDPTQFEITDLFKTSYDPVARVLRAMFRKAKVQGKIPVVASKEPPLIAKYDEYDGERPNDSLKSKYPPASNAFVPPVAGLIAASYAIQQLIKDIPIPRKSPISTKTKKG